MQGEQATCHMYKRYMPIYSTWEDWAPHGTPSLKIFVTCHEPGVSNRLVHELFKADTFGAASMHIPDITDCSLVPVSQCTLDGMGLSSTDQH